jgi:hypothetical protein
MSTQASTAMAVNSRDIIQAEINSYEKHIRLLHCMGVSLIIIVSCIACLPIIFAVPKMEIYGHYIVFATIAMYTLCLCIIIVKWRFSIIDNRRIIADKMKLMVSSNPLYIV